MSEQQDLRLAERRALLEQPRTRLAKYVRLSFTLAKLYFQSRLLIAQNLILSCKLRMWDAIFLYLKIQIFLIRLANGIPLGDCWPAEKSLPPVTR